MIDELLNTNLLLEEGTALAAFARDAAPILQAATIGETAMTDQQFAPPGAWDAIATQYDRYVAPGEAELAAQALSLAGLSPGDRFLDVAAGTGGLSLPAARLGASVVATDWAPRMIDLLRQRAGDESLDSVSAQVMDCHDLAFDDASFDVCGSQFGVMLVPDQDVALREMARVVKPGGRVLVVAYGSPARFEALQAFVRSLKSVVPDFHGLPDDPPPLEFQAADPEVLRERMIAAGLRDVAVHTKYRERIEAGSGTDLWNWCLGGNPIPGMLVSTLDDAARRAVIEAADALVAERANGNATAVFNADVNIAIGTR